MTDDLIPSILNSLAHGQLLDDFRRKKIGRLLTSVRVAIDQDSLSVATKADLVQEDDVLTVHLEHPLDNAACLKAVRAAQAGKISRFPQIEGTLPDQTIFSASLPLEAPMEGFSDNRVRPDKFTLDTKTPGKHGRKGFAFLTQSVPSKHGRKFEGTSNGIAYCTYACGTDRDYLQITLEEEDCQTEPKWALEAYLFALSFFYGTRVNYRCFSIQEGENEHSEFVMKSPQKAVQFPTPVDWTEWQDDEHGVYVAKMPDAEAMKALEQFANYYLQHDYSTVTNMMEYCWELSVDAHIGAMVLNVAVAIECIAESLVIRKEAEVQEAYEELIRVVLEDIAPGWIKAGDNKLATLERQRAVNRFSGVVARRKELGGKKLVEQAFKDVGAPCANSEMDLWQKARNSTAHGNSKERKSAQEMLDRFYKVVDLLYRLVLSQMNYTGRRYDYYTKGWPVAEFLPPSRNQDTSE